MPSEEMTEEVSFLHSKKKMVRCVAKLTDDLMVEILSRLPTKSFFRFQCISKSWLALSNDPCYQNIFPSAVSGLIFNVRRAYPDLRWGIQHISLSNNDDDFAIDTTLRFLLWNTAVISSCNGLLLCRSWVSKTCGTASHYVCNPATRKWVVVPKTNDLRAFLALGFEPHISRHYHILCCDVGEILEFMIFSSKTNKWVVTKVPGTKRSPELEATFFNGIFYVTAGRNKVLRVDPEGKFRRRIKLPESVGIKHLGHSGGYLHYMLQRRNKIKVWMREDCCRAKWVLKHCIDIRATLQKHRNPETQNIRILEFHPNMDVVFLRIGRKIYSYLLNYGRLEEVGHLGDTRDERCFVYSPRLSKGFGHEVA
ncbi:F-box protein At5g49610-like [Phoenix dactylifera]|uniref:F-box protein At5g49610-like n=1 Tax=Phoenix dactylifera TaxID=42345 RepID=A0A8B7BFT4_PHODC|nr:F-box protein At5g49610-like [Phoenix dactylifera]